MRGRFLRAPAAVVGLLLAAAPYPGDAEAQTFRFLPQVGLHVPVSDFGEVAPDGVDGAVELGRKSATMSLGLAAEANPRFLPVGARVTVTYGTSSPVPYVSEDCVSCRTRAELLSATASTVVRPIPRLAAAQPYLLAGGGLRWVEFERDALRADGVEGVVRDQSRGVFTVGGGVDLDLGPATGMVEVTSVVGRFEPGGGLREGTRVETGPERTMTDVFVTVGLSLSL